MIRINSQHIEVEQERNRLPSSTELALVRSSVSVGIPEENKIRQEDLTKIISSAQKVQIKQETIESRLSELKR